MIATLTKALQVQESSLPQPGVHYSHEKGHLFIVADGMGGHAGGEQASALAVDTIEDFTLNTLKWFFHLKGGEADVALSEFQAALARADAVVIPTRAGGVEPNRVVTTLEMTPRNIPAGVVICSARLGTNDLDEAIAWWNESKVPIWGIVPERVGIAAGPEGRLARDGLEIYTAILKKALRKRAG